MIDKIKKIFSKEDGGNKKMYMLLVVSVASAGWIAYNSFANKTTLKVEGSALQNETTQQVSSEIAKAEVEKARQRELEESGILMEEYQSSDGEERETYSISGENQPDQQIQQLQEQIQQLKKQLEEIKKEKERQKEIEEWAVSQIGRSVEYGNSQTETQQEQGKQQQTEVAGTDAEVFETVGVLLDEIRLAVNQSKMVRIKTDRGLFLIRARATQLGIVFDSDGTVIRKGKKEKVYVQVEDFEGNTNLMSYVIDRKGSRITKTAFLSFLKGFSSGMVDRTVRNDALGGTTTLIEGGLRSGVSKGFESGIDVLVREEQGKLKSILDTIVLLKGERLKLLVIKGGV